MYFRWKGKLRRIDIPHIERQGNRTDHNDSSKYDKLFGVEELVNPFLKKNKNNTKEKPKEKPRISKNLSKIDPGKIWLKLNILLYYMNNIHIHRK